MKNKLTVGALALLVTLLGLIAGYRISHAGYIGLPTNTPAANSSLVGAGNGIDPVWGTINTAAVFTNGAAGPTVTATTATSLVPTTGTGSMTLQSGFCVQGREYIVNARGYYSNSNIAQTFQLNVMLGSQTLATMNIASLLSTASNYQFNFDFRMSCYSATSLAVEGTANYFTGTANAQIPLPTTGSTTPITVSSASQLLDVTAKWGASGGSIMVMIVSVTKLN